MPGLGKGKPKPERCRENLLHLEEGKGEGDAQG